MLKNTIKKIAYRFSKAILSKTELDVINKILNVVGPINARRNSNNSVLVECLLRTPKNNIEKYLIAKEISDKNSLNVVSLVKHTLLESDKNYQIYKKFGVKDFISVESAFLNLFRLIHAVFQTIIFFLTINDSQSIANFKKKNILIGDLLYDSIIRDNKDVFTVNKLDVQRDFTTVLKMFVYFGYYEKVLNKFDVKFLVTSHKTYLQYGILCKLVKAQGGVVILKDMNLFKVYDKEPVEGHIMSPESRLVESNIKNEFFCERADKYIIDRFNASSENMDIDVLTAFKDKKIYTKDELLGLYELKNDRKVAFIMPHAFSDSPHVGTGIIFNDYYEWLVETLKVISRNTNFHVFIKPHPTSYCWGEKGIVEDLVEKLDLRNIFVVPGDLNTNCVPELSDVVITCQGTIALESACFGTPSIVAGHGYFHGYNLTNYFESRQDYLEFLENFEHLNHLSDIQKRLARVVLYTEVSSRIHSSLVPTDDILPIDDYYSEEEKLWCKISNLLCDYQSETDPLLLRVNNYINLSVG